MREKTFNSFWNSALRLGYGLEVIHSASVAATFVQVQQTLCFLAVAEKWRQTGKKVRKLRYNPSICATIQSVYTFFKCRNIFPIKLKILLEDHLNIRWLINRISDALRLPTWVGSSDKSKQPSQVRKYRWYGHLYSDSCPYIKADYRHWSVFVELFL